MCCKLLGETIDIHSGGIDLLFPHHSNEIAQSEASSGGFHNRILLSSISNYIADLLITGKQFSKFWMHSGFVNFNDEKMSKSAANVVTLRLDRRMNNSSITSMFLVVLDQF